MGTLQGNHRSVEFLHEPAGEGTAVKDLRFARGRR
ncbi:MAG: hypothetical protein KatS3mg131_1806 [Candidatus Tectimicrobiota bacterium]|nr:MAG: hypothetical protein KatS3mg131_1806 [Candidatus Tectomicrobia bacterium]